MGYTYHIKCESLEKTREEIVFIESSKYQDALIEAYEMLWRKDGDIKLEDKDKWYYFTILGHHTPGKKYHTALWKKTYIFDAFMEPIIDTQERITIERPNRTTRQQRIRDLWKD